MYISHTHKVCFIHNPGTAGKNIKRWLDLKISNENQNELCESYFTFGFVRNPYHRAYSMYKHQDVHTCFQSYLQSLNSDSIQCSVLQNVVQVYKYELLFPSLFHISEKTKLKLPFVKKHGKYTNHTYFEHYSQGMIDIINVLYSCDFERYEYYKIPEIICKYRFPQSVSINHSMSCNDLNMKYEKINRESPINVFQQLKVHMITMRRKKKPKGFELTMEILTERYNNELKYYISSKWIIAFIDSYIDYGTAEEKLLATSLSMILFYEKQMIGNFNLSHDWSNQNKKICDSPYYSGLWHYANATDDGLRNKLKRYTKMFVNHETMFTMYKFLIINSIIHDNTALNGAFKRSHESASALNILFK